MLKKTGAKIKTKANSHPFLNEVSKIFAIMIGAVLVAAGLELFLVPNGFLDGGVVGISIILSKFLALPLGAFIGVLNIPFIIIAYRHSGWRMALRSAIGIATLSFATIWLHHFDSLTDEFTLALGYGGLLLGVGVGLALRFGGALDGTEILSVTLANKVNMSVDQIILFINFFIFVAAAFVLGIEPAMASFLLFYLVVAPIIKKVMDGESNLSQVQIISTKHMEITEAIHEQMNRKVVLIDAHKDSLEDCQTLKVLHLYVSRIEDAVLTELVESIDSAAIIAFTDVANIRGGKYSNNSHH